MAQEPHGSVGRPSDGMSALVVAGQPEGKERVRGWLGGEVMVRVVSLAVVMEMQMVERMEKVKVVVAVVVGNEIGRW